MQVTTPSLDAVKSGESFAGQVALVTGGAGGIGRALVRALAQRGASVVSADRVAHATDAERARVVEVNVTRRPDVQRLVDAILASDGRLDILVNVAGVVSFGAAETLDEAEWDRVLDINLKGTFLCCQAAIAPMRRQRYGRVVNLGSLVGKNAGNARPWIDAAEQRGASNVAYGASKAAVHALTGFLAKEVAAYGVTVNAVAPGPVATEMTTEFPSALRRLIPVGRMGSVDDVVHSILFLASREAGFVNGEILDVNGGMWCD